MPDLVANWSVRCDRMRSRVCDVLKRRKSYVSRKNSALDQAKILDEVRHAQLLARIQNLEGREARSERSQMEFEQRMNGALYRGVVEPSVKVDVAGVVFLSAVPFASFESSQIQDQ